MSQQGEAAEQIVNMATNVTVKGVECATNLAGKGALSLATFLIAVLKDQKRTKGKARMKAFNGKPTKVFVIKNKDMKIFAEEAKKYGVLYAAVVNKKQPDGLVDVVVNANDAARVNRIADRFALSTVDVEKIRADIEKSREAKTKKSVPPRPPKRRRIPWTIKRSMICSGNPPRRKLSISSLPTLRKSWQTLRRRGRKNRIRPRLSQTAKSVPTRRVLSRSAPDPPCGSRSGRSRTSAAIKSRSSPPVIKRGRPRTSSRRKTNIEEKEGKCNGELRQSVFKSAAAQRETL